ncbi:MAG: methylmalonyl-CoA carboxyltransferase, partial [Sphingomonadales bacterium]|nr:methylmalonyl-CoA carboxyltransferase [Sphingomonadales bacterium]
NSKHIGADYNYAWPGAEIAVMGAKGAAEIIFRHEIQSAEDPQGKWDEKITAYTEHFANPYQAAARGYVDAVIVPSETRRKLITAFARTANKAVRHPRKKHGNIPL